MANKLICACYAAADDNAGNSQPVLIEPPLAEIVVDFTSGAAKGGSAFPSGTQYIEITADTACHWTLQLQSASAAATTSMKTIGAGGAAYRRIPQRLVDLEWGISAVATA